MGLQFVLGLPGAGKTHHCLEAMARHIAAPLADNAPRYFIVPEQFSLQAERLLATCAPSQAVMGVQALSFGRLAYQVFARTGGAPVKQLDETGRHMLLRRILQEEQAGLSFYARAIDKPGFIENLGLIATEFFQYDINAEKLAALLPEMP